ncbi:unnamed protein product, partial [Brassica napus]
TLRGNVDGKKGNASETHGTSNRTHGDVEKVDMCVLNPAPRNPGWKWGRGGCYILFGSLYHFLGLDAPSQMGIHHQQLPILGIQMVGVCFLNGQISNSRFYPS